MARLTYSVNGMLKQLYEPSQYDERQALVEETVRREVDRVKKRRN
jgi:hypothetical protein